MRVLFLSVSLPVPANNGKNIRTISLLKALADQEHELTFVSFTPAPVLPDLAPLRALCRAVHTVCRPLPGMSESAAYGARLRSLLKCQPYAIERFRCAEMRKMIENLLASNNFDVVIADDVFALVNLPPGCDRLILNCHNVEHIIIERYASVEKSLIKRLYAGVEAKHIRKAERNACRRSILAMVCSEQDRSRLLALDPERPVVIVPNCVDTESYVPDHSPRPIPTLLYQGGMDWYPNRDAVEFFVGSILPAIRKEFPHVRFIVAGRNPPPGFSQRFASESGVEFTGTVPDMQRYLSQATVVVVPLRIGGGTRIKILEAGAAAKPVVSTHVGVEGLEFEPGRDIVVADSPAEFARSVIELLSDPCRCTSIGTAAREKVESHYSHAVLQRSVSGALSLVGGQMVGGD